MKVLQLINSLEMGGAEKLVTDMAPLMNASGVETDVLLLNGKQTLLYQKLLASGVRISSIGGNVYNPMHIFRIIGVLKEYDVVHVHLFPALYWTAFAKIASFSKTKLVWTEHSTQNNRRSKWLMRIADRICYNRYARLVAISDGVLQSFKSYQDFSDSKLAMIPNGIQVRENAMAEPYPKTEFFDDADSLLIQVSSFREAKDQKTVLRALRLLPESTKLLLVGEGPTQPECEKLADALGVRHRVLFLGVRSDLGRLVKSCDVAIQSSVYEGFGLAALEAMAARKPLIASDVPGLAQIVDRAGLLFEQGNETELASLVSRLVSDSAFSEQIANACQARAFEYDIEATVAKYIELYKSLS